MPTFLYKASPAAPTRRIPLEALLEKLGPDKKWADFAFPIKEESDTYPGKYKKRYDDFVIVNNPGTPLGHTLIANRAIRKGAVLFNYPGEIYSPENPADRRRSEHCLLLGEQANVFMVALGVPVSENFIDGSKWMGFGSLLPALPDEDILKKLGILQNDKPLSLQEAKQIIATANVKFSPDNPENPTQMVGHAIENIPKGATLGFDYFHAEYFDYMYYMQTGNLPCFLQRLGGGKLDLDDAYTIAKPLLILPTEEKPEGEEALPRHQYMEQHLPQSTLSHLDADGAIRSIPVLSQNNEWVRVEFPSKLVKKTSPQDIFVYMHPVAKADLGPMEKGDFIEQNAYLYEIKQALSDLTEHRPWMYDQKGDLFVLDVTGKAEEAIDLLYERLSTLSPHGCFMVGDNGTKRFLVLPAAVCTRHLLKTLKEEAVKVQKPVKVEKEKTQDEVDAIKQLLSDLTQGSQWKYHKGKEGKNRFLLEVTGKDEHAIAALCAPLKALLSKTPFLTSLDKKNRFLALFAAVCNIDGLQCLKEEIAAEKEREKAKEEEYAISASLPVSESKPASFAAGELGILESTPEDFSSDSPVEQSVAEAEAKRKAEIAAAKTVLLDGLSVEEIYAFIRELQQKAQEKGQVAGAEADGSPAALLAHSLQQGLFLGAQAACPQGAHAAPCTYKA